MGRSRRKESNDFRVPRLRPAEEEEKWLEKDYWEDEENEEDEDLEDDWSEI